MDITEIVPLPQTRSTFTLDIRSEFGFLSGHAAEEFITGVCLFVCLCVCVCLSVCVCLYVCVHVFAGELVRSVNESD